MHPRPLQFLTYDGDLSSYIHINEGIASNPNWMLLPATLKSKSVTPNPIASYLQLSLFCFGIGGARDLSPKFEHAPESGHGRLVILHTSPVSGTGLPETRLTTH